MMDCETPLDLRIARVLCPLISEQEYTCVFWRNSRPSPNTTWVKIPFILNSSDAVFDPVKRCTASIDYSESF
jgi:hypothetical protein